MTDASWDTQGKEDGQWIYNTSELTALTEMDGSILIITHSLRVCFVFVCFFFSWKKSPLSHSETFSVQFAIYVLQPSMVQVFISFVSDNTHSRLFGKSALCYLYE